jgi:small nuclear ribonucleoprotein (snRNP)-like protein
MKIPTKQIAIIVVLLFSFLLSPVTLVAQTRTNDWSRLNTVATGTKLSVKLKDGKKAEGTLTAVTDTSLSLTVKNAAKEIRREDIATVHEVSKKGAGKATLIGMGIGAGVGAGLGLAAETNDESLEVKDAVTAGMVVLGAGIGALTGFLIGRSGKKRVLLYEFK